MNAVVAPNLLETAIVLAKSSVGGGKYDTLVGDLLKKRSSPSGFLAPPAVALQRSKSPIEERLAHQLLSFKKMISPISRYLAPAWRDELIQNLDRLFDVDDWDADFTLPEAASFATFLRLIIHLHPTKRPGIGLSARGHILASWSRERDRIVIECLASDELRWVLSQSIDGCRESAAGKNRIQRLVELLEGYEPDRFFQDADQIIA